MGAPPLYQTSDLGIPVAQTVDLAGGLSVPYGSGAGHEVSGTGQMPT